MKNVKGRIRKVLFATRFGEMAFNSLEALFALKEAGLRTIVLCHIIPRQDVSFVPFGGYLKKEADELKEESRIKFEDWRQAIAKAGMESRAVVEVGEPVPDVMRTARREDVDLLVAGRGPRALEIAKRSWLPVLLHSYMAPFEAEGGTAMRENRFIFEKPLLAAGLPGPSQKALFLLQSLAGAARKAAVVHVLEKKWLYGPWTGKTEEDEMFRLKEYCGALQDAGIEAEAHLLAGEKTAWELVNEARAVGASMIIASSSDKEKHGALGSVARELCEMSEFPVLLVPVSPHLHPADLD